MTAPVLYGQLKVGPAVARFLRDYEKVSVDLVLLDRVVNMVEEGIDVGIRIGPLPDSSLVATRIGEVRTVIVATPRVLRRVGVPKHPRQLSERPAVRFHGLSSAPSWRFVDRGKSFSVPVAGAFSCNHAATAIEACVEGLGFGRFLSYQVEALVAQKRLRVVLEAFEPAPLPVHVVYANARLVSPGLRAFIDSMKVQLQA